MNSIAERTFEEMEERLQRMTLDRGHVEGVCGHKVKGCGGESQRMKNAEESQSEGRPTLNNQEEKKRMQDSLQDLMDKYEEM